MGQILYHKPKRKSRRRKRLKRGLVTSVIWDTKYLEVARVYVGFTAKESLRIFLSELRGAYTPEYDDSADEMSKAFDRYKIEEIKPANVIIKRMLEKTDKLTYGED